jgi:hypothetical protein
MKARNGVKGLIAAAALVVFVRPLAAQPPRPEPPRSPRESAAIDLTGYWVSIVNEDWRWRMVTAPKGDYPGIPLNAEGRKAADAWDPATDGSCLAFGAAGLMRMPARVHITWANDKTLKIETDNGQQTRLLPFEPPSQPGGAPSLQGQSKAEWARTLPPYNAFATVFGAPGGPPTQGGSLKVMTTNLRAGWLRRNGVPYSSRTVLTEYFDRFPTPTGDEWFMVTTIVQDPTYLMQRFVTSSHFKREPDGSKWSPKACKPIT